MDPIRAVQPGAGPAARAAAAATPPVQGEDFARQMTRALSETNQLLVDANRASDGVAAGTTDAVDAVLALSKAEVALRHAVSMSTRMLEAYREVMRLQL